MWLTICPNARRAQMRMSRCAASNRWPAAKVREGVKIVEGRRFEFGRNEVIVGRAAAREFAGLDLGGEIDVNGEHWKVVGIFTDEGGLSESEIWTSSSILQAAFQRGTVYQTVIVNRRLAGCVHQVQGRADFRPAAQRGKVQRETKFYASTSQEQSRGWSRVLAV